jgi:hypothetical protein
MRSRPSPKRHSLLAQLSALRDAQRGDSWSFCFPPARLRPTAGPNFYRRIAMTVIISNNDGLAKLREEARRRRTLRYKGPVRPYRPDTRPTYEAPTAATRTIVGDWFTDELGNLTRIIAGA